MEDNATAAHSQEQVWHSSIGTLEIVALAGHQPPKGIDA